MAHSLVIVMFTKKCQYQLAKQAQVFRVEFHRIYAKFLVMVVKQLNEQKPEVLVQVGALMAGEIIAL